MNEKYQAMLHRAERGELSEAEIDMVAQELQKVKPEANPYTLLHILGESGAKSYQGLVEQFLESQANPSLAALALQILCTYWGETSQYTGQVLQFLRGVPWDRTEDCRLMAASVAGEHLRTHLEPDLLRELLRIYEDAAERQILREAAYLSLAPLEQKGNLLKGLEKGKHWLGERLAKIR